MLPLPEDQTFLFTFIDTYQSFQVEHLLGEYRNYMMELLIDFSGSGYSDLNKLLPELLEYTHPTECGPSTLPACYYDCYDGSHPGR
jgi:hypothetical protein